MDQNHLALEFRARIDAAYQRLMQISEAEASTPYRAGGWLRKQVLGHLLDSAANNHVRIAHAAIAGQFEGPGYDQDEWVRMHNYAEMAWPLLLSQWQDRNRLLARFVEQIPENRLQSPWRIAAAAAVTLRFVITDYLSHLDHHVAQITSR